MSDTFHIRDPNRYSCLSSLVGHLLRKLVLTMAIVVVSTTIILGQSLSGDRTPAGPDVRTTKPTRMAIRRIPNPSNGTSVFLSESFGRQGIFVFWRGNFVAQVAADPMQGMFIAPLSDPKGAHGAWVRLSDRVRISSAWFGAAQDGFLDDTIADQAAINFADWSQGGRVYLGARTLVTRTLKVLNAATTIEGQGWGLESQLNGRGSSVPRSTSASAIVWGGNTQTATFTGSIVPCVVGSGCSNINNGVLTVTGITGSLSTAIGSTSQYVFSAQNPSDFGYYTGPVVTSDGSGSGGTGTYNLNQSFAVGSAASPVPMEIIGATSGASAVFRGYVSGSTLTVTSVSRGAIRPASTANLYGTDFSQPVASGTTIVRQLGGTVGGNGTYEVTNPSYIGGQQTAIGQNMVAGPLTPVIQLQDYFGMGLENIRIVPGPHSQNVVGVLIEQSIGSSRTTENAYLSRVWVGAFAGVDPYSDSPNTGNRFQQGIRFTGGASSNALLQNIHVHGVIDACVDLEGSPDTQITAGAIDWCAVGIRAAAPLQISEVEFGGNSIADFELVGSRAVVKGASSEGSRRMALFMNSTGVNKLVVYDGVWEAGGTALTPISPDGHIVDTQGYGGVVSLNNFSLQTGAFFGPAPLIVANNNYTLLDLQDTKGITPSNMVLGSLGSPLDGRNVLYRPIKDSSFPVPWQQVLLNYDGEHPGDNQWQSFRNDQAGKFNIFGGPLYVDELSPPLLVSTAATCSGACNETYTYAVTALTYDGETSLSNFGTVANAASLNDRNFNTIEWAPELGAYAYRVYGRINGSLGLLATITYDGEVGTTNGKFYWSDLGVPTPGNSPPNANDTGNAYIDGALKLGETAGPTNGGTKSIIWNDRTAHRLKFSYDRGTSVTLPGIVAHGTKELGTSAISAGSCTPAVGAVAPNIKPTDVISWSFKAAPGKGWSSMSVQAYSTADRVNFRVCNHGDADITPAAAQLNWLVLR